MAQQKRDVAADGRFEIHLPAGSELTEKIVGAFDLAEHAVVVLCSPDGRRMRLLPETSEQLILHSILTDPTFAQLLEQGLDDFEQGRVREADSQ